MTTLQYIAVWAIALCAVFVAIWFVVRRVDWDEDDERDADDGVLPPSNPSEGTAFETSDD